jgi:hypothetical protein
MKHRICTLFFTALLTLPLQAASGQISLGYTSLSQGNTKDHLTTLFATLKQSKPFFDGKVEINAALSANLLIDHDTPLNYFTTLSKANFLIEELSVDYFASQQMLLSFGRQRMHLNLLNGSFDGLLAAGNLGELFVKAYYFRHYTYLSRQLFEHQKIDSLKGITLNYSDGWFDSELSYFNAEGEHRSDLYAAIIRGPFKIGIEQMQFISSIRPDERAYKIDAGFKYHALYLEGGYIDVYQGGLNQIYAFGGSEFNSFALTGFLDRRNASKHYLDLHYRQDSLYVKLHAGRTDFDVGASSYTGKEYGVTLSYHYRPFRITLQALSQKSDQAGIFGERLSWIETNLEYRF